MDEPTRRNTSCAFTWPESKWFCLMSPSDAGPPTWAAPKGEQVECGCLEHPVLPEPKSCCSTTAGHSTQYVAAPAEIQRGVGGVVGKGRTRLKPQWFVSTDRAQKLCEIEVAVLYSQSLIVRMVSVDVKHHWTRSFQSSGAVRKSRWTSWAPHL